MNKAVVSNEKTPTVERKHISREEFDKKIEIEYEWLVRWSYMNKDEAKVKAKKTISSEFFY
jgi:hypothetical protein